MITANNHLITMESRFDLSAPLVFIGRRVDSESRWQRPHTAFTAGRTSGGRGLSVMKARLCASAATPSSAPTPVPSAIDPSLWNQR